MTLTVGSLFSGVGGIDLAFERAGCRILWQSEIDRDACRVLANHFPGVPNLGDIRQIDWSRVTRPDVIVGGFPCQGVSTAGKRRGLADERSGLFWDMLRVIDELQPAYVLWENVPGLLTTCSCESCGRRCKKCGTPAGADDEECGVCGSDRLHGRILPSHRGADFYAIISALGYVGMDGAWTLLDAQWFGVPQRRRRLFGVFAQRHLGAERCVEILSFTARLFGSPETSREAGEGVARSSAVSTLQGGGRRGQRLDAESAAGGHVIPILEAGARQGVGADQRDGTGIGAVGDPMFSLQAGKQHGVFLSDTAGSITTRCGKGPNTTLDDGAIVCVTGERTHALTSEGMDASEDGTGRGAPIIPFDTTQVTSDKNYSHPREGDTDHPLAGGAHPPAIAGYGARRLTPTECERLQGLPDHWTVGLSDSARYRCLGNSVAVPCVEWIARRLVRVAAAESPEDATA